MGLTEEESNQLIQKNFKTVEDNLLKKYNIPIQYLDFDHVKKCNDGTELEKILKILRSREEGYYPDLIKVTEERLAIIKPKSKLLRKACPVIDEQFLAEEERNELKNDVENFVKIIAENDKELDSAKRKTHTNNFPEIRKTKQITDQEKVISNNKKIFSTDYESWDKYDVDSEILKMDLEEERIKKDILQKKIQTKSYKLKQCFTQTELLYEGNDEKEKGNEYFRTGDYNEALKHYTNSIEYKPTLAAHNNRAITLIKLNRYERALDDVERALQFEPQNLKALLRKAQALDGMGKYQEGLTTIESLIQLDANNRQAQELAEKFRKKCNITRKKKRITIQETNKSHDNTEKEKESNYVQIPIPGTSKMPPPYYINCKNNEKTALEAKIHKFQHSQILNVINIDQDSDQEDSIAKYSEEICQTRTIHIEKKEITNKTEEEKGMSGEPHCEQNDAYFTIPDNIHSPYSFLTTWNSVGEDPTYKKYAEILRSINMNRLVQIIGCKMDYPMFRTLIKCIAIHFTVPSEIEKIYSTLKNIARLPRFSIISMFIVDEDRQQLNMLFDFLQQHGKPLPQNIVDIYNS